MNTPQAQADVGYGGIKAYSFCEGFKDEIESLLNTIKVFMKPAKRFECHVPPYMEKAIVGFWRDAMYVDLELRETQKVEIDKSTVRSGDFIGLRRLDGLGAIFSYGTGAHIGHNAMAMWFDGELYVVESTDPGGLQRSKWDDWMANAERCDEQITYHRLSDEARAKFDEKKA